MTTIEDFIRLSKSDAHNNLDLGMRYPTYVMWAGFYVPEFPQDGSAVSPDLARTVKEFTQTRVETEADIANLLTLSLNEAEADKCTKITATFNNLLMKACDTPENFVSVIDQYSRSFQIEFKSIRFLQSIQIISTCLLLPLPLPFWEADFLPASTYTVT